MEETKPKHTISTGFPDEDLELWWAYIGCRGHLGEPHYE